MATGNRFFKFMKLLGDGGKDSKTTIIMMAITVVNILLTLLKAFMSYYDGSLSIASSGLESFGDVFSCFVIALNRYKEQTASPLRYPRGRSASAQGYNICAWIMITVALISLIIDVDRFLFKNIMPSLNLFDLGIMGINILLKSILWLVCYQSKSGELEVLKMDQLNDILNNTLTVISLGLALYISPYFDLVGAFIICAIIIRNWSKILSKYNKRVHGHVVSAEVLKKLVEHAADISHGSAVKEIVAYYRGYPIVVEIYIHCEGYITDFRNIASFLRSHMLTYENVETVHVFPFDSKKISCEDIEAGLQKTKKSTPLSLNDKVPLVEDDTRDLEDTCTETETIATNEEKISLSK